MSSTLAFEYGLWLNGLRVGTWFQRRNGQHGLVYDASWLQSEARRPLSLSLPLQASEEPHLGRLVENYFENLLPDSPTVRTRLQSRFQTRSVAAGELLGAIGRDCVGALQILPVNESPGDVQRISAVQLTEAEVETVLASSSSDQSPSGPASEFRISIAGAQEKTALLLHQGTWCRPLGATPTTHIMKLPLGIVGGLQLDLRDSVENEWLCSQILRQFGLPVPSTTIAQFGAIRTLVVERFDRLVGPNSITRLPQEDFCQALGLHPDKKYEADGGPDIPAVVSVLKAGSNPLEDCSRFAHAILLFWLLAATDGHGKNFSIFLGRRNAYHLTPFYDVLSAWPIIGTGRGKLAWQRATLAMSLRGKSRHRRFPEIRRQHFVNLGILCDLDRDGAWIDALLARIPSVETCVSTNLPAGFPNSVAQPVFEGIRRHAQILAP